MANDCYFRMEIKGTKKSLKEFISILEGIHPEGISLYKVYDVFAADIEKVDKGFMTTLEGCCAYSINTSMLNDEDSYYRQLSSTHPDLTNLESESKRLSLEINIYSEEIIEEVEEYVLIKNGKVKTYELKEFDSYYDDEMGSYVKNGGFGILK